MNMNFFLHDFVYIYGLTSFGFMGGCASLMMQKKADQKKEEKIIIAILLYRQATFIRTIYTRVPITMMKISIEEWVYLVLGEIYSTYITMSACG